MKQPDNDPNDEGHTPAQRKFAGAVAAWSMLVMVALVAVAYFWEVLRG